MLALESRQQQHFPYFSPDQVPVDSAVMDSFAYQPMPLQNEPAMPHSYYDSIYLDQQQQNMAFLPNSPPSMAPSHRSGASGPSISSAPSSVIGSPYSGTFQDSWADTSNGLAGLPGTLMNELEYTSMGPAKFGSIGMCFLFAACN